MCDCVCGTTVLFVCIRRILMCCVAGSYQYRMKLCARVCVCVCVSCMFVCVTVLSVCVFWGSVCLLCCICFVCMCMYVCVYVFMCVCVCYLWAWEGVVFVVCVCVCSVLFMHLCAVCVCVCVRGVCECVMCLYPLKPLTNTHTLTLTLSLSLTISHSQTHTDTDACNTRRSSHSLTRSLTNDLLRFVSRNLYSHHIFQSTVTVCLCRDILAVIALSSDIVCVQRVVMTCYVCTNCMMGVSTAIIGDFASSQVFNSLVSCVYPLRRSDMCLPPRTAASRMCGK